MFKKNLVPCDIFRYIVSAESDNLLIWHRLTEQVIFKEEQQGIKQLTLIEDGTKILSISKPSNPAGQDLVRTNATVCVRAIPGERIHHLYFLRKTTIEESPSALKSAKL